MRVSTYHELNQPYTIGQIPNEGSHGRVAMRFQLGVQPSGERFSCKELHAEVLTKYHLQNVRSWTSRERASRDSMVVGESGERRPLPQDIRLGL